MDKFIKQCSERLEQCNAQLKYSYYDKNSKCLLLKTFWLNLKLIERLDKKTYEELKEQYKKDIDFDLYQHDLMKTLTSNILNKNEDVVDVDSYLKRS